VFVLFAREYCRILLKNITQQNKDFKNIFGFLIKSLELEMKLQIERAKLLPILNSSRPKADYLY